MLNWAHSSLLMLTMISLTKNQKQSIGQSKSWVMLRDNKKPENPHVKSPQAGKITVEHESNEDRTPKKKQTKY